MLIITAELPDSHGCKQESDEFRHNTTHGMWQTVPILEWTEALFVDGLTLRLVAPEFGTALRFPRRIRQFRVYLCLRLTPSRPVVYCTVSPVQRSRCAQNGHCGQTCPSG